MAIPIPIHIITLCATFVLARFLPVCCQDAAVPKQPNNVSELRLCLDTAAANLQDYTVTGTTESNGRKHQFKMTYKRPNLVRIDTHEGQVSVQPNGEIKGRLGSGLFGKIARKLGRDDKRLKDAEGIPFYESDFVSTMARVQAQIQGGAAANMKADKTSYYLEISSADTIWKYAFARSDFSLRENSRRVKGKQVEITRYTDFHANGGITVDRFKF